MTAEVQLVTPELGGFEGVRVRAALWQVDGAHAQGFTEAYPAVEVAVTDPDHWVSLDTTNKASHKEAGVGGLAIVRCHSSSHAGTSCRPIAHPDNVLGK